MRVSCVEELFTAGDLVNRDVLTGCDGLDGREMRARRDQCVAVKQLEKVQMSSLAVARGCKQGLRYRISIVLSIIVIVGVTNLVACFDGSENEGIVTEIEWSKIDQSWEVLARPQSLVDPPRKSIDGIRKVTIIDSSVALAVVRWRVWMFRIDGKRLYASQAINDVGHELLLEDMLWATLSPLLEDHRRHGVG